MRKEIYTVINICFEVCNFSFESTWRKFVTDSCRETCFSIIGIHIKENFHGLEDYKIPLMNNYVHVIRKDYEVMLVENRWEKAIVLPERVNRTEVSFTLMLFYTHAVQRHILYLHSSLVDYQGNGLMFLGPSGIGKTTQAELWNKYRDALIINGDVVFVQETEDVFLGWGTPWHGSSPYCENTSVSVSALIVLKQAEKNSIRELTGFEKVTAVSESVFYPRWLENGMELCLEILDHLLSSVPVYELSCRPDEEAVRLVEETVFGK